MDQKNKKLSPLAYQISLQLEGLRAQKILVAYSGGSDSAVLLNLLLEMRVRLKLEIAVAHIHHGDGPLHRDLAYDFAKQTAEKLNLSFYSKKAALNEIEDPQLTQNSQSEASLRKLRAGFLEQLRVENQYDWIAFGHHAQDLFETRLIRLIRGTGVGGIESMSLKGGKKLRPLLAHWPDELNAYIKNHDIAYLTDPSNQNEQYLRNWIRHRWMKDLEIKRPGSNKAFARSLELLVGRPSELEKKPTLEFEPVEKLPSAFNREEFRRLERPLQAQAIAQLLRKVGSQNYSQNMIQEVLKRLDTPRKQLKFIVAGCEWQMSVKQILVRLLK
jgi:tRNA(Ile)-lysidine synthase